MTERGEDASGFGNGEGSGRVDLTPARIPPVFPSDAVRRWDPWEERWVSMEDEA